MPYRMNRTALYAYVNNYAKVQETDCSSKLSRPATRPTQSPNQRVLGCFPGGKAAWA